MRSKSVSALASLLRPRRLAASSHSHRGRYVIPHEHVRPAAAPTCCSEDGAAVNQTCTPGVLRRARRNRPQSYTRSVPLRKRCRRPTQMYCYLRVVRAPCGGVVCVKLACFSVNLNPSLSPFHADTIRRHSHPTQRAEASVSAHDAHAA